MKRFKNILFVADGSHGEEDALHRAVALSNVNNADLTFIDVLDVDGADFVGSETEHEFDDLQQVLRQTRYAELSQLRNTIKEQYPGLTISVKVESGDAAINIIRAVIGNNHDLVIKAPEQPKGMFLRLFGSTDMKLMRKCPCPIWISKDSKQQTYQNILAAVDLAPSQSEPEPLSRTIMTIATSLASMEACNLHVAHVWRLPGEHRLRGRQVTTASVDRLLLNMRENLATQFKSLLKEFPHQNQHSYLVKGHAGKEIPAIVEELSIDLIVIGTVGRTGIPGLIIGNTAEKVLGAVDCSVLALKPEGFESPIRNQH